MANHKRVAKYKIEDDKGWNLAIGPSRGVCNRCPSEALGICPICTLVSQLGLALLELLHGISQFSGALKSLLARTSRGNQRIFFCFDLITGPSSYIRFSKIS